MRELAPGSDPDGGDRLVARTLSGDARAARMLYDAHVDQVYRLAVRLTGDTELARECTQQAFARAFQRLETFRGDSSFGTWLHRLTVNVTLSQLRRVRRIHEMERELGAAGPELSHHRDPDPILQHRITKALAALPEASRKVVVMHDVEGFTHEEIGTALDIATGTSKARLSRARARLRMLLAGCAPEYAA